MIDATAATAARAFDSPSVSSRAESLAVEIGLVEVIAVCDDEGTDAEARQEHDDLPSQPPGTDDGNPRIG